MESNSNNSLTSKLIKGTVRNSQQVVLFVEIKAGVAV